MSFSSSFFFFFEKFSCELYIHKIVDIEHGKLRAILHLVNGNSRKQPNKLYQKTLMFMPKDPFKFIILLLLLLNSLFSRTSLTEKLPTSISTTYHSLKFEAIIIESDSQVCSNLLSHLEAAPRIGESSPFVMTLEFS